MGKRVLIIVSELQNGGAQRVASRIAGGMADLGAEVHVMEFFHPPVSFVMSEKVILHKMCENEVEYRKLGQFARQKKIKENIITIQPDVIIPFLDHVCQKVLLACFATPYYGRVITTLRNSPYEYGKMKRAVRDFAIHCSRQLAVQNNAQKEYFVKQRLKRIAVVANPVNVPEMEHIYSDNIVKVVAVGRLNPQKNFAMLIKAFAVVVQNRKIGLKIFGRGECEQELNELIQKLGMQEQIALAGYSDNVSAGYKNADLFVMSADYEGMPNALMEAMAEGLPCISTDCETGPSDLIQTGKNGILVPVNDENAMTEAILRMCDNAAAAIEMGKCAKEMMRNAYSLPKISEAWLNAFKDWGL